MSDMDLKSSHNRVDSTIQMICVILRFFLVESTFYTFNNMLFLVKYDGQINIE